MGDLYLTDFGAIVDDGGSSTATDVAYEGGPGLSATDVEAALDELATLAATGYSDGLLLAAGGDDVLTDLTAATELAATDIMYAVVDPAGTPLDRKVTHAGVFPQFCQIPASGQYLGTPGGATTTSNGVTRHEREFAMPIYVPATLTFTGIGCWCDTLFASSEVRLGIRAVHATTGGPGTLILDAGTASTGTSGEKTITISQALNRGWYWLVVAMQGASGNRLRGYANTYTAPFGQVTADGSSQTAPGQMVWIHDGETGAFDANPTFTSSNDVGNLPVLWLKR